MYLDRLRCFLTIIALFPHQNHALQKKKKKKIDDRPILIFLAKEPLSDLLFFWPYQQTLLKWKLSNTKL